jgi:hypothetical protein
MAGATTMTKATLSAIHESFVKLTVMFTLEKGFAIIRPCHVSTTDLKFLSWYKIHPSSFACLERKYFGDYA